MRASGWSRSQRLLQAFSPAARIYTTVRFFSDGTGVEDGGLGPEVGVEGHRHVAHGEPAARCDLDAVGEQRGQAVAGQRLQAPQLRCEMAVEVDPVAPLDR